MKLTKYQHACITLEEDGQMLVVDPGGFSSDFIAPAGVVGVVITHQHSDHFDTEHIAEIMDKNSEAVILAHPDVISRLESFTSQAVQAGEIHTVGPFTLEFHGGLHALIHKSIPQVANLGVLVNDLFYYPGDSFTLPGKPIDTLALPVAAPWLKDGEVIDFLDAVKPRLAFPTHDAILSIEGKEVVDNIVGTYSKNHSILYERIEILTI